MTTLATAKHAGCFKVKLALLNCEGCNDKANFKGEGRGVVTIKLNKVRQSLEAVLSLILASSLHSRDLATSQDNWEGENADDGRPFIFHTCINAIAMIYVRVYTYVPLQPSNIAPKVWFPRPLSQPHTAVQLG